MSLHATSSVPLGVSYLGLTYPSWVTYEPFIWDVTPGNTGGGVESWRVLADSRGIQIRNKINFCSCAGRIECARKPGVRRPPQAVSVRNREYLLADERIPEAQSR